jgi:hypothetical protein
MDARNLDRHARIRLQTTAGMSESGSRTTPVARPRSGTTPVASTALRNHPVMPGLVPDIHANATWPVFAWMAGSGPAMTEGAAASTAGGP